MRGERGWDGDARNGPYVLAKCDYRCQMITHKRTKIRDDAGLCEMRLTFREYRKQKSIQNP